MKLFAIYGDPVTHSKSPQMHNYVFKILNFKACYTRIHLKDGEMLRKDFLERRLDGANITVPHKEAAFLACDEIRGFANKVKVVNTIVREDEKLIGYNTDADGFIFAMQAFKNIRTILVLGAGGTSKALTQKFVDEGFEVTVVNRSANRLEAFRTIECQVYDWDHFEASAYDLIVNTTSAGLKDDHFPIDKTLLERLFAFKPSVADAVYGKRTPFLSLADTMQLRSIDGEAMLVGQGVLANALFTYLDKDVILPVMQKALSF